MPGRLPLLATALDYVGRSNAPANVEGAHAPGAVELVAGEGQHIDVVLFDVDGQMAHSLDGVGVEKDAGLLTDRADFPDWRNWVFPT